MFQVLVCLFGPLLAPSFWPLTYCQNVASLSLLYSYDMDRISFRLAELGSFLIRVTGPIIIVKS